MYAGGINFTSLLFMNVYRIYILLIWFDKKGEKFFFRVYLCPFVDDLIKKGERNFGVLYMHVYACLFHSLFYTKREKNFKSFIYACLFSCLFSCLMHMWFCLCKKGRSIYAKRREVFREFIYVYFIVYVYMFVLMHFIEYLYLFIVMHELRGRFYEA